MERAREAAVTNNYDIVALSSDTGNDNNKPVSTHDVERLTDWLGDSMRSCSNAVGAIELQRELDILRRSYLELYVLRVSRKNDRVTERQNNMLRRAADYMVECNWRLARYRGVTVDA